MSDLHLIVLDIEATHLDTTKAVPLEVAWWDLHSGVRGCFVPPHDPAWILRYADPDALRVNGYRERLMDAPQASWGDVKAFRDLLDGQALAGKNVGFYDAHVLPWLWKAGQLDPPKHSHRMWELGTYAAAVLRLPPGEKQPNLAQVCDLLGIPPGDHTASGDVDATGRAFLALFERAGVTL